MAKKSGLEISFSGEGSNEKGFLTAVDEQLFIKNVGEQYLEQVKSRLVTSLTQSVNQSINQFPFVAVDPTYFRPTEVDQLIGDPSKAKAPVRVGTKVQFKRTYRGYDAI